MAAADSVKAKIRNLIALANGTTAAEDENLTAAVNTLISGYGKGTTSTDLSAVDVYVADYLADELTVTTGALDRYERIIVS